MSHVTYECVMSNMNESSRGTYEWDMSHIPVARKSLQQYGVHTCCSSLEEEEAEEEQAEEEGGARSTKTSQSCVDESCHT